MHGACGMHLTCCLPHVYSRRMDSESTANEGRTGGIRNVGVRLPAEDYEALKVRARSQHRTIADHVRWLVDQDVAAGRSDAADRVAA